VSREADTKGLVMITAVVWPARPGGARSRIVVQRVATGNAETGPLADELTAALNLAAVKTGADCKTAPLKFAQSKIGEETPAQ
jgi:hypothetical protein